MASCSLDLSGIKGSKPVQELGPSLKYASSVYSIKIPSPCKLQSGLKKKVHKNKLKSINKNLKY